MSSAEGDTGGRDQNALEFATEMRYTAVEALCTSLVCLLFVCVLSCHTLFTCHKCYVRADMFSISMLVVVHYGCNVTCDIMLH